MYTPPLYNEKILQELLSKGDETAFEEIYKHYQESLMTFLLRYIKVPELAEDLSQEIFGKIWEARKSMDQVESFRAYLFTIARNHTLNFLNRAIKVEAAKSLLLQHLPVSTSLPDNELISREYKLWLQHALQQLSPQMRQVFQLIRQEYRTYDEVATELGISRNTVKKHMVRSMKILRNKLDEELGLSLTLLLLISSR